MMDLLVDLTKYSSIRSGSKWLLEEIIAKFFQLLLFLFDLFGELVQEILLFEDRNDLARDVMNRRLEIQGASSVLFLRDLPHPVMEGQIRDSSLTSDLIDDRVVQSPSDGFGTHCLKQSVHQVGCFVGRQIEGQFDVHLRNPFG